YDGTIAGVNVGRIDREFIINPSIEEQEKSDLSLTVAGTKDAINMVEAEADEVTEDVMLDAIMFDHEEIIRLVAFKEEISTKVGKEKRELTLYEDEQFIMNNI